MLRLAVDGHDLEYEFHGEGPPILFVHGLAGDRAALVHACEPAFDGRPWRRIYVDLPGHGGSRGDASRATADGLVAALAGLVAEIGGPPPAVVGYSYGGYLALGLVAALESAAGLFLACPVVEPDHARRRLPARRFVGDLASLVFADDVERDAFSEIAVAASPATLEAFRRAVHPGNRLADRLFVATVRAHYQLTTPVFGALGRLDAPVSVVCGRDDHWVGFEDAVAVVRCCPRSRMTVVPGCGHLFPFEAAPEFQRLLGAWVESLPPPAPAT